ncbi:MAG: hypothetical protein IPK82_27755 [Polyangiaceae bacterium]|nr:hypothetical protein [Polyangiaceae bacterium]
MISFGHDGDQKRVHKTTATHETLYFADLYERVKDAANAITERFYVYSPERVIAIVTRGGNQPGTTYVHADHLGSVDVLTDADGKVTERRSYDAFGQRRNPEWGAPIPASFPDSISLGFTGHEDDGEIGLVNMKGRMFDPKLGRFVSTDPIVQDWTFSQAWNPYSYVFNNPLTYTDPSGFDGEPKREPGVVYMPEANIKVPMPASGAGLPKEDKPKEEKKHGVGEGENDVNTTGLITPLVEPEEEGEDDQPWYKNPVVEAMAGAFNGALLGIVPFAGAGEQIAQENGLIERRSVAFERGKALGMIGGGLYTTATSISGEIGGGLLSATGVGAVVGVPAIAISTAGVLGGSANVLAGVNAWMSAPKGDGAASQAGSKLPNEKIAAPPTKRGNAPKGDDGHPVELHHRGQKADGPIDEMTRTDHRAKGNFSKNHSNTGQKPSEIDRAQWKREQKDYWEGEWDSGRFTEK